MANEARRAFLGNIGSVAGAAWLAAHWPAVAAAAAEARAADAGYRHLAADDAAILEALAACIIPSDDRPGAREAGAIWFMDAAMGGFMGGAKAGLAGACADVRQRVTARYGTETAFEALSPTDQEALMPEIAAAPWFGLVHLLTVAGTFSMPSYGGNCDGVGWELIGFDHRHAWQPPFGYYDAEASGDGA